MPALTSQQKLDELVLSCRQDPLKFVTLAYPWGESGGPLERYEGPDTWQEEFLIEWGEEIRKRNFDGYHAVDPIQMTRSSGHGIGKGVMTAFIVDFIMSTRRNCRGSVTANTFSQLETKTWATIQKWTKYCITRDWFEITTTLMWAKGYRESWATEAISCAEENSEAFAGQHAAESTSFYLFDEGSNVPDSIYNKADGGLTDGEPMIFVFGNPTRSTGKFFRINFGSEREYWLHKAIDSRTCKFGNKDLHERWRKQWGEDSDRFRVQVKGIPPGASDTQFISSNLVAAAQRRSAVFLRNDPVLCGLDISRGGNDSCVFRFRRGLDARTIPSRKISGVEAKDSTVIVNMAIDILKNGVMITDNTATNSPFGGERVRIKVKIDMLFIDGTGIGGPICDQIKAAGYADRVIEVQAAGLAPNTKGFQECANMRAWMWENGRVWLSRGAIDKSTDLESDLVGPMYSYNNKNQLVIESKKSILKRRGSDEATESSDEADGLLLTFARLVAPRQKSEVEEEETELVNYENFGFDGARVDKSTGWS